MHLKVKTYPNSKKLKIIRKSEDDSASSPQVKFEVYVKEKAERGLANKAVIKALSSYLKVPAGKVRLIKGAKSKNKIFEVGL